MSNTTARTDIYARIAGEIDSALRVQLPCDLFDLESLFRRDQAAAYAQLAQYTDAQRELLAQAFAALFNARFDLAVSDQLTASDIAALWRPHLEPSAPATAAAEHSLPSISSEPEDSTMINITLESEVTPAPLAQIRMLAHVDAGVVAALRLALTLHHADPAFTRALDKFIGVAASSPLLFDGATLAIASQSEHGKTHVTDGASCTCRGASHAFCYHRAGWALLRALDAVCDPFAPASADVAA